MPELSGFVHCNFTFYCYVHKYATLNTLFLHTADVYYPRGTADRGSEGGLQFLLLGKGPWWYRCSGIDAGPEGLPSLHEVFALSLGTPPFLYPLPMLYNWVLLTGGSGRAAKGASTGTPLLHLKLLQQTLQPDWLRKLKSPKYKRKTRPYPSTGECSLSTWGCTWGGDTAGLWIASLQSESGMRGGSHPSNGCCKSFLSVFTITCTLFCAVLHRILSDVSNSTIWGGG